MNFLENLASKVSGKSIETVATSIEGTIVNANPPPPNSTKNRLTWFIAWFESTTSRSVDVLADSPIGNLRRVYKAVPWGVNEPSALSLWGSTAIPQNEDKVTLSFKGGNPNFPIVTAWRPGPISIQLFQQANLPTAITPTKAISP